MAECEALAEIATLLGLPDDAALLRRRQKELGDLINTHMYARSRAVLRPLLCATVSLIGF